MRTFKFKLPGFCWVFAESGRTDAGLERISGCTYVHSSHYCLDLAIIRANVMLSDKYLVIKTKCISSLRYHSGFVEISNLYLKGT